MSTDPAATIVTAEPPPPSPRPAKGAALARLAFGSVPSSVAAAQSMGPRHLAFLPPEALELDLDDPEQRQFGDYELLSKLGQGGMGVVYRARQRSLDREVAVKLLSAGPWASPDFIERFRREAQSAARMQHPNIVAIYEIGAHDELNFFSMRLVQGVSLAHQLLESGPLPPRRAAQLMRTIAEALDYAHRLGVLHLDLKPANVMIDERGEPQVADFGLARRLDETLTRDNDEVSGTPSYMAPEQAQIKSHKLSQATDIYGLGAILYELLTGRPPFLGASPHETLQRVITLEPTRPSELVPTLSRDLEAVCLKCLAKDPSERYPSARAMGEDLARFVEGRPVSVRPLNTVQRAARWARREPRLAMSVAVATVALLVGIVATTTEWRRADANATSALATAWAQRRDGAWQDYDGGDWLAALPRLVANLREEEAAGAAGEAESDRRRLGILFANSPRLIDVVALGGIVDTLAVSPDGEHIAALTTQDQQKTTLHLIDAAGTESWKADVTKAGNWLVFSADGRALVLGRNPFEGTNGYGDGLVSRRFDVADGSVQVLQGTAPLAARLVTYDRSAKTALVVDESGALSVRRGDGASEPWRKAFAKDALALFSSDGSAVGYADVAHQRFELLDAGSGTSLQTLELPAAEHMTRWLLAPDGQGFVVATDRGRLLLVQRHGARALEVPDRCASTFDPIAYSDDGHLLAATCALLTSLLDARDASPMALPIDHPDHPVALAVDAVRHVLFANERGNPRVYRLPPVLESFNTPAPVTPVLATRDERRYWAGAFDAGHGLMAIGTQAGEVKLWRVPRAALSATVPAPIAPLDPFFDGAHLAAVRGTSAFAIDARDGHEAGPMLAHPGPVWFAELLAGGDKLLTMSGRELRVWNWREGTPRFAPLQLANTPLRVVPRPDGAAVLTSVGVYRDGHMRERLQLWATADGRQLAEAEVPGPLEGARFSPDASRLLGWRGQELWLRDGATLAGPSLTVMHRDDQGPVDLVEAHMGGDGELHATTRRRNANCHAYYWRWDARTGALRERLPLTGTSHRFVTAANGALGIYGFVGYVTLPMQRRTGMSALDWMPQPHGLGFNSGLAYDASGRLLAAAPESGVLLMDSATGSALSPWMPDSILGNDSVAQLAFAPDGREVVARSALGRWLLWNVAPDSRPLGEIEDEVGLISTRGAPDRPEHSEPLPPATRAALHARDPGASVPATVSDAFDPNRIVPKRAPGASGAQLDLGGRYTPIPDQDGNGSLLDLRSVPLGTQRWLDLDFDVRGALQLAGARPPPTKQTFAAQADGIALPPHAARVHLLVGEYASGSDDHPVLDVVLHYRDGGESRSTLKLRGNPPGFNYVFPAEIDPEGETESWRGARLALLGSVRQGALQIRQALPVWLMSVPNPEPARELASLSLVARSNPFVLAITAESQAPDPGTTP